ncbi:DUF1616 domain-containing protein [Halorarum halophilum]|uniref:DUF1616 domain-containing protein n=1 Tax=Halorarum halophilum TaxID=2743090 RepID=A0A7D5GZE2_9EURY|nr:DUF1616 domain-containing protein [Halobaculum halophilum]QLG27433.1 DUF1616 domain-containing protein [Halobaculum halophilum]
MRSDSRWWQLLPAPVRRLPADLTACALLVCLTLVAVFLPVVRMTQLRILLGLPFVLFAPGYALIAALFPEAGESPTETTDEESSPDRSGIDGIERVALSFGTSIAVVPLVGLVLNFTPFGIRLLPLMVSLSGLTFGLIGVAAHRRWALSADERFSVPYQAWYAVARSELVHPESRADAALNVLLVICVILAASSVAYAVAVPNQGERFTEFYLLTETDDGELVADGYPIEYTQGQPQSLIVGIENQEYMRVDYTVVVELQRVVVEDNSTTVSEREELKRWEPSVAHNETWHLEHSIAPGMTGTELKLTYLLYQGDPPSEPTVDNAYRELHLWVNVSAPAARPSGGDEPPSEPRFTKGLPACSC